MTLLQNPPTRHAARHDQRRQRLLGRIGRRFQTVTQQVTFGPLTFPFTRVADPDIVLDEVAEQADRRERLTGRRENDEHLHLPYWAELWDSATGVGAELVGMWGRGDAGACAGASSASSTPPHPHTPTTPPPSTLDLGCGMGLSGTVAAALGARVLFADLEPAALLFAAVNSLPWRQRVRTRRVNWRTDQLGERFGLIVGADILYERVQWPYLEPFWRAHLAAGGTVLLGEPGRQTGDLFIDWIAARGWSLHRSEQKVPTRAKPVRIFRLTKGGH